LHLNLKATAVEKQQKLGRIQHPQLLAKCLLGDFLCVSDGLSNYQSQMMELLNHYIVCKYRCQNGTSGWKFCIIFIPTNINNNVFIF
jgi:hypothetical protein